MGRATRGVRGMRLDENDEIVGVAVVDDEKTLLTVTELGLAKRTSFEDFRTMKNRGGRGVICHNITERSGKLCGISAVSEDDDVMLITNEGTIIRTAVAGINLYSRGASGVIIMRTDDEAKIINFTRLDKEEEIEAEAEVQDAEGEKIAESERTQKESIESAVSESEIFADEEANEE